jgi:carbonic anhydrase
MTECIKRGGNQEMKKLYVFFAAIIGLYVIMFAAKDSVRTVDVIGSDMTSDKAIALLAEGNARFVADTRDYPNQDQSRRTLTSTKGQHPFATVIACSDSRVPVETIFDRGIGDIFVIRVAGNVIDTDEAGSIEYGVDHLATPVLVVLGHTHCGAVTAVVNNAPLHGNIPALVDNIVPAALKARDDHPELKGGALVDEAVKYNIWQAISDLFRTSSVTAGRVKHGKLKVIGAMYDIATGQVSWLGAHPDQKKLLAKYGQSAASHKPAH